MKFLLINPPIGVFYEAVVPPLGLAYLAAALRQAGHDAEILDINLWRWPEDEVRRRLAASDADAFGITGLISQYTYNRWLAEVIKQLHPDRPVVQGGMMVSAMPQFMLEQSPGTDIVAVGEGEQTIVELADALDGRGAIEDVKGLWYRDPAKPGEFRITGHRPDMPNIEPLPYPAWDLVDIPAYWRSRARAREMHLIYRNMPFIPMLATRGCPYRCNYCHRFADDRLRHRSTESMLAEINHWRQVYGIKYVDFQDELWGLSKKRAKEFCEALIATGWNIKWGCSIRLNVIDDEMVRLMAQAGCVFVSFGVESGSETILTNMNRPMKRDVIRKGWNIVKKYKLDHLPSFMIGYVGETPQTIAETVDLLCEMDVGSFAGWFRYVTPLPGTELYEYAKAKGLITDEVAYIEEAGKTFAGLTTFDKLLCNLTDMSDDELRYWREWGRRQFLRNHLRRNPVKYPLQLAHDGLNYVRRHGLRRTLAHVPEVIKQHLPETHPAAAVQSS
jgi:anaerobic magnesium-protoporphyrin IX monomethyl ester cyclase